MTTAQNDAAQRPANCRRALLQVDEINGVSFDTDSPAKQFSELIVRRACECLENHPHFRGQTFTIEVRYVESESVLHLQGSCPSFFLKQMLQSALRDRDRVAEIQNDIEVLNPADPIAGFASFGREKKNDEQE